ncbi:MAG: DNA polymerase III subunit gamma/tau, partial [Acidobacteria bacterium]|nr:DNA polymerase III subunit gamma/tau [Acidobacteriota bacterium]
MTYQAIARKYRPQTFEEVIGQEPIVRTLTNAIEKDQVAHAYIFSGTRGVGKTTTARILAKALNCQQGPTTKPCGQCPACTEIAATTAVDVIEIDAASNRGIDEIRELRENVRYLPARDRFKVFIIDEAHMLTNEAFNALLKTLEEPPARVLFILATTEPHKIPSTIHSRCQSFHFRSIGFQEILDVLARVAKTEKAEVEKEALAVMARAAEGSLRDSLSILDQALAYCGTQVSADAVRELLGVVSRDVLEALVDAIREQSSEKILSLVDALVCDGHNLQHFCRE